MTIEEAFTRLALNSGRIADALEALLASQGHVVDAPDEQGYLDFDSEGKSTPTKKKASKKASKKKAKNEVVVGKQDDDDTEYDLPMIRAELHKLQEQENQAAVKSVLKKFGASTLGQVDEKKYSQLFAKIQELLDE